MNLLTLSPVPAAGSYVSGAITLNSQPHSLTTQFNFVYGSGGTSINLWLQTSLDGGTTWVDIAQFGATTASKKVAINQTARTPETTQVALGSGTLAANTAQDGILGVKFQVIYTIVGAYVGSTLTIDLNSDQITR